MTDLGFCQRSQLLDDSRYGMAADGMSSVSDKVSYQILVMHALPFATYIRV